MTSNFVSMVTRMSATHTSDDSVTSHCMLVSESYCLYLLHVHSHYHLCLLAMESIGTS